eukprot:3081107-Rhodomonas_salina.1
MRRLCQNPFETPVGTTHRQYCNSCVVSSSTTFPLCSTAPARYRARAILPQRRTSGNSPGSTIPSSVLGVV